jgi:hypothetical protein
MKFGEFLPHRPLDCKENLGDWMLSTRVDKGFHLTKKACSVLITTIFVKTGLPPFPCEKCTQGMSRRQDPSHIDIREVLCIEIFESYLISFLAGEAMPSSVM